MVNWSISLRAIVSARKESSPFDGSFRCLRAEEQPQPVRY
jgi:hypothetical protein